MPFEFCTMERKEKFTNQVKVHLKDYCFKCYEQKSVFFNRDCYIKKFLHLKRYRQYLEMMSKGVLQPEKMPPTNRAARFHCLRAHHQILIWKMLNDKDVILDPKDWGWFVSEDAISPIKTNKICSKISCEGSEMYMQKFNKSVWKQQVLMSKKRTEVHVNLWGMLWRRLSK